MAESYILTMSAFSVTLTMKTAKQPFCITLWLVIMLPHTKFGNKWCMTFLLLMMHHQANFGTKMFGGGSEDPLESHILIYDHSL